MLAHHGQVRVRTGVFGFCLGVACSAGVFAASNSWAEGHVKTQTSFDRSTFERALEQVVNSYVDPLDEPALLAQSLKEVMTRLDSHSHYLTAKERGELRKRAAGGTLGLHVILKTDPGQTKRWLEIVAVEPDSAAAGKGLSPGDHILGIDGRSIDAIGTQIEASTLLSGKPGGSVVLAAKRSTDPRTISLQLSYAKATAEPVRGHLVEAGEERVACLSISRFSTDVGEHVKRELASLRRAAGPALKGIVLDVRGNPGGVVSEALVIADLFVDKGILTRTRGRGGRILREEMAHAAGTDLDTPVVVLQDRYSASASELLAIALQDHGRALVVGEHSYGKGSVQRVTGFADGSVMSLTIARYFSPNDRVIDGIGVQPDIVADVSRRGSNDAGLDAALRALNLTPR